VFTHLEVTPYEPHFPRHAVITYSKSLDFSNLAQVQPKA